MSDILRVTIGSHAYGSANELSDRDEWAIVTPSGGKLSGPRGCIRFRTAAIRTGNPNAPSQAGDIDAVMETPQHFIRRLLGGDPHRLIVLFAPIVRATKLGEDLRSLAGLLWTQDIAKGWIAMLAGLNESILCIDWTPGEAAHALRWSDLGAEWAETGRISFPLTARHRSALADVKRGKLSKYEILCEIEKNRDTIMQAAENLAEEADKTAFRDWCLFAHDDEDLVRQ